MPHERSVTIVIPVYKDWTTLQLCMKSLKKYVSPHHQVYLVNDMSNEWADLEKKILQEMKDCPNFHYARNESNMGFVKTCNRAVNELDQTENDILLLNSDTKVTEGFLEEMLEVLYVTEKHGIVCPRSNNATLLSIPLSFYGDRSDVVEESYRCYLQVKNKLPRYQVLPTGVGFCILIRRELINNFGLFDEIYGKGYNEENDFILRVNAYGFSTVMANRAFVFHYESRSFGKKQKDEQEERNAKILLERYPFYTHVIYDYFYNRIHPIDYFADLFSDEFHPKKKILFSLYNLNPLYNGTAVYGLTLLEKFYEKFKDKYDISVLVNIDGDKFHHVSEKYPRVMHTGDLEGTYHLAVIPSQIYHLEHLMLLNRHCLRFIFTMQDIITLRCQYLLSENIPFLDVFRFSIQYADGIVSISDYTKEDMEAYFCGIDCPPIKRIYHGINIIKKGNSIMDGQLPFESFVLIFGNAYSHKAIKETVEYLKESDQKFIILGYGNNTKISENIYGYKSGFLSEEFIANLYEKSKVIVFPSLYEGFGLPIIESGHYGKRILVKDNSLNHELCDAFPEYADKIYFFKEFYEIPSILEELDTATDASQRKDVVPRSWDDVAKETESFVEEVLLSEVNEKRLEKRWNFFTYLQRCQGVGVSSVPHMKQFMKEILRRHAPSVFYFLKRMKNKMSSK